MKIETNQKLQELKESILIFDVETCSSYPDGRPIDIRTNFDDYVLYAKCKWFGCYSYKYSKYVCDEVKGNEDKIKAFIAEHNVLIGFNNEEFDTPIITNNNLLPKKRFMQTDLLCILGSSTYTRHDGLPFKNRGGLMGFKFKNNSLKAMAQAMKLEIQKGDIDYTIFFQDSYTDQERIDILKYLKADVEVTKLMFDKLWDFWYPFTEFISDANILNLSWIKSSIASLTYKAACHTMGVEETYGEKSNKPKEEMGGRVIDPKYEESRGVWYVDFASLYPHIYCMFNLFNEIKALNGEEFDNEDLQKMEKQIWHGNDLFKVKGYYDISNQHPLAIDVAEKLVERAKLKKEDPENPLIYVLKIFLNSLYGAQRSEIFEKIHTPNGGWDCCWLGQQIQELLENMMTGFGFETIAGDTDSIFIRAVTPDKDNKQYVQECLQKVVDKIKANVPFPCETFKIDIENKGNAIEYIMWPFSDQPIQVVDEDGKTINKKINNRLVKVRKAKKKNYMYIANSKVKIVGLPIMKDNATALGKKILEESIKPRILKEGHAKFDDINFILETYLKEPDNLRLLVREFKVKAAKNYKNPSQIQAQISEGYFDGQDGVAYLIKNKKCGKAGKTAKYCTMQEAIDNKLEVKDLDLTKLENELEPFRRMKNE